MPGPISDSYQGPEPEHRLHTLLDFIDAGAGDDEPVKGITQGDIRTWYDEYHLALDNAAGLNALETLYVKRVNDYEGMKAAGRLTKDWGEAGLIHARTTLEDIRRAHSIARANTPKAPHD